MVDLHRHDESSTFDGFGKSSELAPLALSLGHTSFSTTNHGTTANWVQHYFDCKAAGIKPILGVEAYFKPVASMEGRGFHLCLFAKNLKGYYNINRMMLKGEKNKYYNPIITFEELEECCEGVICSTACIASYSSQMIKQGKKKLAIKYLEKMSEIFGDDFYVEIQPYTIDDEFTQEKVDYQLMEIADELGYKCILTSDSHYGSKLDFDTYLKMHEIAKHNSMDIEKTYGERYMPTEHELVTRFIKMYKRKFEQDGFDLSNVKTRARKMIANLQEIEDKIDGDMLDNFQLSLPKFSEDSNSILRNKTMQGLKSRSKYKSEYIKRCEFELEVIEHLDYADYFLMVADYVNYAKDKGIAVGPGRGSCCNSLVCYALGITDVDSLMFELSFSRFLRKDKKKMPDIDLDFETARRDEVLDYLLAKYKGHAAQVSNYGLYKVDNLINDLAKVCGLNTLDKDLTSEEKAEKLATIKAIKKFINSYKNDTEIDFDRLRCDKRYKLYNEEYDDIVKHFCKLFKKIRYFGTHAAGVAITGDKILARTAVKKAKGKVFTYYDLNDLDKINVTKFDILGLNTMEEIKHLREITGDTQSYDALTQNREILENFRKGNTTGVFQFESNTARQMLIDIDCDCFNDIVAVNAMNRPGPLSLGMPQSYAENKFNVDDAKQKLFYKYTAESYGTIIYQEQIQEIAVNIGKLSWDEADKIMKMMKGGAMSVAMKEDEELVDNMRKKFIVGAQSQGMSKSDARELFDSMITYSFNKGHATGYSLISVEEMYYKINYPVEFWNYKLQMTSDATKQAQYKSQAIKDGCVIFLPHVNGTANLSIRKVDGDKIIQDGLATIKGVGLKAAQVIEKYAPYMDFPDFEEKMSNLPKEEKRCITSRVINLLKQSDALEFRKDKYLKACTAYNTRLYSANFQPH